MLRDLYSIRYMKRGGRKTYHLIVLRAEDDFVVREGRNYTPDELPLLMQYVRERAHTGERLFTSAPMTQIEREIDHRRALPMIAVTDLQTEIAVMRTDWQRRESEAGE